MMNDEILVPLDLSDAIALIDRQKQEIAALKADAEEIDEEAGKARLVLLLNHGHKGPYLDDGEMQCSECGMGDYDFKIPPLSELTKRIVFSLNEQIAALAAENGRLKDKINQFIDDESHGEDHGRAADARKEGDDERNQSG
jgi:hypothetical protein